MALERYWKRFGGFSKRMIGYTPPLQFEIPTSTLDEVDKQLVELEALAAIQAGHGCDVTEASRLIDDIRHTLANNPESKRSLNTNLNHVRWLLHEAPERHWFSRTIWAYCLVVYEFVILGVWAWVIVSGNPTYVHVLDLPQWSLLDTIFICTITGSISATVFTLYGMYTHMSWRNMAPAYVPWYLIRPVVGGVMGAFIALIADVLLTGVNAQGVGSNIFKIGVAFLAGSNEKFAAQMIDRFMAKVLGGTNKTGAEAANSERQAHLVTDSK